MKTLTYTIFALTLASASTLAFADETGTTVISSFENVEINHSKPDAYLPIHFSDKPGEPITINPGMKPCPLGKEAYTWQADEHGVPTDCSLTFTVTKPKAPIHHHKSAPKHPVHKGKFTFIDNGETTILGYEVPLEFDGNDREQDPSSNVEIEVINTDKPLCKGDSRDKYSKQGWPINCKKYIIRQPINGWTPANHAK